MNNDNNVIAFPPKRTIEAELPSLWDWERRVAQYGHYVWRDDDGGAIGRTDGEPVYIQTTTGRPTNQAGYRLDWTGHGWTLWAYDDHGRDAEQGAFRTLRDALETICPTDKAVA